MFRNSETEQPQIQVKSKLHTFIHMLCLSFEISKCFVIYIPLLNTQPKKNTTTTRIRRDHQYGKIHALFPRITERRKKNIRLNNMIHPWPGLGIRG